MGITSNRMYFYLHIKVWGSTINSFLLPTINPCYSSLPISFLHYILDLDWSSLLMPSKTDWPGFWKSAGMRTAPWKLFFRLDRLACFNPGESYVDQRYFSRNAFFHKNVHVYPRHIDVKCSSARRKSLFVGNCQEMTILLTVPYKQRSSVPEYHL